MSTLDQRLYAWLLESDDRKFELAFRGYFSVAFPSLVRHLGRLSRWDPSELEEIAQDALLRFFEKAGRERRQAAEKAQISLADVQQPLALGPLHARNVASWTADVTAFIAASMGFQPPAADTPDLVWKSAIRELSNQIPILQSRGYLLFGPVQMHLKWPLEPANDAQEVADEPNGPAGGDHGARQRFAEALLRERDNHSEKAVLAEQRLVGVLSFVDGTVKVIRLMPRLRVPTNGYLFEITTTVYLDECKKRGRRKRGGRALTSVSEMPVTAIEPPAEHPLDRMEQGSDGSRPDQDEDMWTGVAMEGGHAVPTVDPTRQYEDREFFEKFTTYLRSPVDAAMDAYSAAQARGHGIAERRRLDSVTAKYSRMMAVLSSIGEGYTQEKTADRLDLTRNQVKYILEQVEDAYATFVSLSVHSVVHLATPGAQSHAE